MASVTKQRYSASAPLFQWGVVKESPSKTELRINAIDQLRDIVVPVTKCGGEFCLIALLGPRLVCPMRGLIDADNVYILAVVDGVMNDVLFRPPP